MDPRELRWFEQQAKIMKDREKQIASALKTLDSPAVRNLARARQDMVQYNALSSQMPNMSVQKTLVEAARYFNSPSFHARKEALLKAQEIAQQIFGREGIDAAQRIASRRLATDSEQVANRTRSKAVDDLLNEAAELASSTEVREAIEHIDKEALSQLDKEEKARQDKATSAVLDNSAELEAIERDYSELSREDLLQIRYSTMQLLLVLNMALAAAVVASDPLPNLDKLMATVHGLTCLVQLLEGSSSQEGKDGDR